MLYTNIDFDWCVCDGVWSWSLRILVLVYVLSVDVLGGGVLE